MQDNIFLTEHFCLKEFTESATARKHGIVNNPPAEAVENLKRLCQHTLEPLREAMQLPVVITSGFRCQRLNEILSHSARRSQHLTGCAADFYIGWSAALNGKGKSGDAPSPRKRLVKAFKHIIQSEAIDYDQLIIYPSFIHVSFVSKEMNRRGILLARSDGKLGYGRISRGNALKIE